MSDGLQVGAWHLPAAGAALDVEVNGFVTFSTDTAHLQQARLSVVVNTVPLYVGSPNLPAAGATAEKRMH